MPIDLIAKLKLANIIGRGGAEYPAWKKWTAVRDAAKKPKYVICNASERELATAKDFHILESMPEMVFRGMELAMDCIDAKEGIFNLNGDYERNLKKNLDRLVKEAAEQGRRYTIKIFEEDPSYIGGEETALLNAMEGRRCEPRLKPPFPVDAGLFGCPTLIHNVETFYDIARVADGTYDGKRFYTISGEGDHDGVYHLPADWTIEQILKETGNIPKKNFFVQAGGGASGTVWNQQQIKTEKARGSGAIVIHLMSEDPKEILLHWVEFFTRESCGKCTPCREGTYQLLELLNQKKSKTIPWREMEPILDVLEKTSFCALGRSVPVPIRSYLKNVLQQS